MASAILVRRNETAFCGEAKVYIRKYTNRKPITTALDPYPPHLVPISDYSTSRNWRHPVVKSALNEVPIAKLEAPSSPSSRGGHVTFDLGAYSRRELKELKKRLVSELQQIRMLRIQIDSSTNFPTRPIYPSTAAAATTTARITAGRVPVHHINAGGDTEILGPPGKKKKEEDREGSGAKRVNPFGGGDPTRKRRAVSAAGKEASGVMKKCGQVLGKLMKHRHGWVFNTPVDAVALKLYDYHQVIKKPMDLGTVKANLGKGLYKSPLDFATDVRLTFNNALTYNPKGHHVYLMAELLAKRFEEMLNDVYNSFEAEKRSHSTDVVAAESQKREMQLMHQHRVSGKEGPERISAAKKLDSMPNQSQGVAAALRIVEGRVSQGKLPKPKQAKDPNKREMSLEEKAKLGMSLQELPPEKMEHLMPIVRKRNGCFVQDGDEIELDIEAIDNETLWELNRLVGYHKRASSKIKGQDRLAIMQNTNKVHG